MSTALRLAATLALGCCANAPAFAQLPLAPEPHPTLDELVKEYQRCGLPIPPKDAELVRVKRYHNFPEEPYLLGFQIPPAKPGGRAEYLVGSDSLYPAIVEPTKPNLAALCGVKLEWNSDYLCLAVQCRLCGWDELAESLFARGRDAIYAEPVEERRRPFRPGIEPTWWRRGVPGLRGFIDGRSVSKELRLAAWAYWQPRMMWWGTDRNAILKYLRMLDPDSATTRDLALTIAPRKSKPGSVDSLIDDLTEYRGDSYWHLGDPHRSEEAYWKLAELGFEAVPALIEHLGDPRFTRHLGESGAAFSPLHNSYETRIGNVLGWLLDDLSLGELAGGDRGPGGVDVDKARVWWQTAQKLGEERWLVDHVVFRLAQFYDFNIAEVREGVAFKTNAAILRALGARYPMRLRPIYQTVLLKCPEHESEQVAKAIGISKLPTKEKIALLLQGASHMKFIHRYSALEALATVDVATFRNQLIRTLEWMPRDIVGESYHWATEQDIAWLVQSSDDPKCWDALAATTRRVSVGLRFGLIERVTYGPFGSTFSPEAERGLRLERIRYLRGFLMDTSVRGAPRPDKAYWVGDDEARTRQVRDYAAERLAFVLGLDVHANSERGGLSRLILRAVVAKLASYELAAAPPRKP